MRNRRIIFYDQIDLVLPLSIGCIKAGMIMLNCKVYRNLKPKLEVIILTHYLTYRVLREPWKNGLTEYTVIPI